MAAEPDLKAEELAAVIREIQARVRARHPRGDAAKLGVPLPDLLPVLHARDAAEGKVASIGSVNPRPPGLVNNTIQAVKRTVARALGWFVRDQIDFNRAALDVFDTLLAALNDSNRAIVALSARLEEAATLRAEAAELADIRAHWIQWRQEWERKLFTNEMQFLRSVADLQSAFHQRALLMESNFRDNVHAQHAEYNAALERTGAEIQRRLWADLERIRLEYERLIYSELRTVRQRAALTPSQPPAPQPAAAAPPDHAPAFDYLHFAERFRGAEDYVRDNQRFYIRCFQGRTDVLDIGCGRGEFLDLMKDAGVPARGIDLDPESVRACRAKGHHAEVADLFHYLGALPEAALDGIFSAQVIEHLDPARLPEMLKLAASCLRRGGVLVLETPNPECLAIFATHFYIDPTHTRPIPPALLAFYLEEFGFGGIEVHRRAPAVETMPSLASLPEDFRAAFFNGLDYAVIAHKLL
ncbi:MAG: class I SAM-dependent methyltransferase [Acidobacteria bacterium]|nr:class I SAM-dependent methyltransferase [Acidobacteriota bacterium]